MATTPLFAEILVVGFQAEAWLALLVLGCFGTEWVSLSSLEKWVALITIVVVATAYVLGVIIDRFSDAVVVLIGRTLARRGLAAPGQVDEPQTATRRGPESEEETKRRWERELRMRFAVMDESEALARFLDYQRSRMRIARATALNTVLAVPGVVLVFARIEPETGIVVFVSVALIVLAAASVFAAIDIESSWGRARNTAYAVILDKRTRSSDSDQSPSA